MFTFGRGKAAFYRLEPSAPGDPSYLDGGQPTLRRLRVLVPPISPILTGRAHAFRGILAGLPSGGRLLGSGVQVARESLQRSQHSFTGRGGGGNGEGGDPGAGSGAKAPREACGRPPGRTARRSRETRPGAQPRSGWDARRAPRAGGTTGLGSPMKRQKRSRQMSSTRLLPPFLGLLLSAGLPPFLLSATIALSYL